MAAFRCVWIIVISCAVASGASLSVKSALDDIIDSHQRAFSEIAVLYASDVDAGDPPKPITAGQFNDLVESNTRGLAGIVEEMDNQNTASLRFLYTYNGFPLSEFDNAVAMVDKADQLRAGTDRLKQLIDDRLYSWRGIGDWIMILPDKLGNWSVTVIKEMDTGHFFLFSVLVLVVSFVVYP